MLSAQVTVNGEAVHYAIGGRGLPVLFLHGWGLDHQVYARSLRRLTARNCRVIAPSLPGFGNTEGLPLHDQSLPAFAHWVDAFLDAIGVDEPVVVMGHSFGGGIATMFAHEYGDRVRHLVILNSVGDPDATGATHHQGFWDLSRSMGDAVRATFSPTVRGAAARHAQRTFVENIVREPVRVVTAAMVAMTADLRQEMANLSARGLPTSILWSDRDNVIPLSGFDTFCSTFGADGQIVSGGHSWLLTRPDAFGDVLDNVLQLETERHHVESVMTSTDDLRRQLTATTLPAPVISMLTKHVAPLWLLSAPADTLAADLALCHPRLAPGEVRAVARPVGDTAVRLTVAAEDRAGLLADTIAVLTSEGLSVASASAMTWPELDLALHSVTVTGGPIDPAAWDRIGHQLTAANGGAIAVPDFTPDIRTDVAIIGETGEGSFVRVTSPDRAGLLAGISRWFADEGLSIESADVSTVDGIARDTFLVRGECDTDALAAHLRGSAPGGFARLVRSVGIA